LQPEQKSKVAELVVCCEASRKVNNDFPAIATVRRLVDLVRDGTIRLKRNIRLAVQAAAALDSDERGWDDDKFFEQAGIRRRPFAIVETREIPIDPHTEAWLKVRLVFGKAVSPSKTTIPNKTCLVTNVYPTNTFDILPLSIIVVCFGINIIIVLINLESNNGVSMKP
jgi:hypothetical protein